MITREESVLAARDPALEDENDWEEFSLCEARVFIPGKSRYAHILSASPDNPVQVTGRLDDVEEEQEALVLDDDYLNKRIVVENVTHYAYGQHSDGEIGVWVAGSAGWFALSPARSYQTIFNDTVEAVDLLYFLSDQHHRWRKRKRAPKPTVAHLLREYVNHTHGICRDVEDSAEILYKHRDFLFLQMLKGEENVNWIDTPVFAHLRENFPASYKQSRAQILAQSKEKGLEEELNPNEKEVYPNRKDVNDDLPVRPEPGSDSKPDSQADLIYQVILDLRNAGHLSRHGLNLTLVASHLMNRYEIDTEVYARDLILKRARTILQLMERANSADFYWRGKTIYKELKAASKRHDLQDIVMTPLCRRSEGSESSEETEPEMQLRPGRRRIRKSLLRPKLSSISAKRTGKRTRDIMKADSELGSDDDDANRYNTPSKIRGRGRQPSALQADIWICQAQGCGEIIHKYNSRRGQELIRAHSLAHAGGTQALLDLVFSEQRLNTNLPVDNLVGRIQGLGNL